MALLELVYIFFFWSWIPLLSVHVGFTFEAGRKSSTGPGVLRFSSPSGKLITQTIKQCVSRIKGETSFPNPDPSHLPRSPKVCFNILYNLYYIYLFSIAKQFSRGNEWRLHRIFKNYRETKTRGTKARWSPRRTFSRNPETVHQPQARISFLLFIVYAIE